MKILVIDDDPAVRTSLSLLFKQNGYQALTAENQQSALELLDLHEFKLVIMDMNYSLSTTGEEGLELLRKIKSARADLPVILITAWGSIALAVEGIKAGAADFVSKPWQNSHLLATAEAVLKITEAAANPPVAVQSNSRRGELDNKFDFSAIIGCDPQIIRILEAIATIAATEAAVLITGESGTGKELIAEAIHNNSKRRKQPFIKVNLGGISSSLFESEMFGYKKGAFTDAKTDRAGRFEMAHRGTIFLDEIGELDLNSQVKLLRVLQERKFEPLGSSVTKDVDFRLICATNRDLAKMVAEGSFREDLYYRINLFTVKLPALRERQADIELLADSFLENLKRIYNRPQLAISPRALQWLKELPWPGNIRELKNLVERTVLMSNVPVLEVEHFADTRISGNENSVQIPAVGTISLDEMERQMIVKALKFYDNNISHTAQSLGLSRAALYRRLEKYRIEVK